MGKSALKKRKAYEAEQEFLLQSSLKKKSQLHKNPVKVLIALRDGKLKTQDIPFNSNYEAVRQVLTDSNFHKHARNTFFRIIIFLAQGKCKKLLDDAKYLNVILFISKNYKRRFRDIEEWKVKTHNRERQVSDLLRHLFANYAVPTFMDQAFYQGHINHIDWFIHIGRGNNIRTATNLPITLTKKAAHFFLKAPNNYSIIEAMRYGQILSLGGDERLVHHINATRLGQSFVCDDFWMTVIQFFIKHPMLDPAQIHPIVDYIHHVKYTHRQEYDHVTGNYTQALPPEKPNFSMKGRTVDSLLREVEKWHQSLQKEKLSGAWKPYEIPNFYYNEGSEGKRKFYQIEQLMNSQSLRKEGRIMKHCVASYIHSCRKGSCSIWSMTVASEEKHTMDHLVTIELSKHRVIVQVRGKYNALPSKKTVEVIKRWQQMAQLQLSKWVDY